MFLLFTIISIDFHANFHPLYVKGSELEILLSWSQKFQKGRSWSRILYLPLLNPDHNTVPQIFKPCVDQCVTKV